MAKTRLTEIIEAEVFNLFYLKYGYRGAFEVSVYRNKKLNRVDYVGYDKKNNTVFIEIKQSLQDFRSKSGHTFYGNKNYYAMPEKLWQRVKDDIPAGVGVYVLRVLNKPTDFNVYYYGITAYELVCVKTSTINKVSVFTSKQLEKLKYNVLTAANSNIRRLTHSRRFVVTDEKLARKNFEPSRYR